MLRNFHPGQLETYSWSPTDPDIILYPRTDRKMTSYRVSTMAEATLHDFTDVCGTESTYSDSHAALSASVKIGLTCGTKRFVYDIVNDKVSGPIAYSIWSKPFVSPSGLYYFLDRGNPSRIPPHGHYNQYDARWNFIQELDLYDSEHFSMVRKLDGSEWSVIAACRGAQLLALR